MEKIVEYIHELTVENNTLTLDFKSPYFHLHHSNSRDLFISFLKENKINYYIADYKVTVGEYDMFNLLKVLNLPIQKFTNSVKTIEFVKKDINAVTPSKVRFSDVGFDLTIIKLLKKNKNIYYYDTCIQVKMPFGYYCTIEERSGMHKQGISLRNKRGVIDPEYTGTLIVALEYDDGVEEIVLPAKVVQLIPHRMEYFEMEEIEETKETTRGDSGGLGSGQFK